MKCHASFLLKYILWINHERINNSKKGRENPGSATITNRSPSQTPRGRGSWWIQTFEHSDMKSCMDSIMIFNYLNPHNRGFSHCFFNIQRKISQAKQMSQTCFSDEIRLENSHEAVAPYINPASQASGSKLAASQRSLAPIDL